jgi:polar amino acid transport system substrate-binding protein
MPSLMSIAIACALLWTGALAHARELRVALVTDRAPYCFKSDGMDVGIEIDVIRAALTPFGHTVQPVIVPKARLPIILQSDGVDLAGTIQGADGNGVYFSDNYIQFHNHAISKKKKNVQISTLADVDNYNFIIWQGGWRNLGPVFEARYKPDDTSRFRANYYEAVSQLSQARMFWMERADVVISDKKIFEHFRKQLRSEFNTDEEVVFHDMLKTQTNYPDAFRSAELRDQFNTGLKKIRANGTYQAILDAYR